MKDVLNWNKLSREAEECPSLEIFTIQQNQSLSNRTKLALLKVGGWTGLSPSVPCNLYHSMFLRLHATVFQNK